MSIKVPPLRERREDIPVLVHQILSKLQSDLQLDKPPVVDRSTMAELIRYDWPGNVRELRNVLERAIPLAGGRRIRIDLPESHSTKSTQDRSESDWTWVVAFPPEKNPEELVRDMKRTLIEKALLESSGNISQAARLLHFSRDAMNKQMKILAISVAKRHSSKENVSDGHGEH